MKFGRTLQLSTYEPWKEYYIEYAKLKKLLREDETSDNVQSSSKNADQWTEKDEEAFVEELVNVQLEKVHKFHKDTYEALRERTTGCETKLDEIAAAEKAASGDAQGKPAEGSNSNGKKKVPSEEEKQKTLKEVEAELDQITKETNELEKYSRVNYTGFLKAAKKHDRKRGTAYRVRPLLQVRLAALPFNKEDYSPLIFRLSAMYGFVRQHLNGGDASTAKASENQEGKEEYKSHKFWVHPENLLEIKTMIMRRLPVLVYNPQTSRVAEGAHPDPSITSIYFDNPDFTLYSDKIEKSAGSSLRLRWYGQLDDKPEIFLEKKTVTEQETSSESRFATKDKYIQRFLKNEYHMEKQITKLEERAGAQSTEAKKMRASVEEIQNFITEHELQPVVRANYTRTAFQIPGDDHVRVSLDTDLAFIREDAFDIDRPCRDPDTWHRADIDNNKLEYPFSSIRKGEITRFPFAVLEFKIKNTGKKNEWLEDIMNSHLVKAAPRFSKFIHGVATLFDDGVNIFPFWLSEMETDIRRDPQQAFEEEQARRQKERDDEFAVGSLLRSGLSPKSKPGIISPVGSPMLADTIKRDASIAEATSRLGTSAVVEPTQLNETAGEPDEDETGIQGNRATDPPRGLKNIFHTFSTSKFAQSRRAGKTRLPPGVVEPTFWIKDQGPLKVEGKVWLANQRTYIKWQHVSVLLAGLSLGLYNAAGKDNNIARGLAVVYTVVALFTAAWGYGVYMWRTRLIERRSGNDFDAITGPIVVCIGLIVALVLNFVFKYNQAMLDRDHQDPNHPGYNHTSQYGLQKMLS